MTGKFYGMGVGPGEPGLLPVAAWRVLQRCDRIFLPRAKSAGYSVARRCLEGLDLDETRFCEIEFDMELERDSLTEHYHQLAQRIAGDLKSGKDCAYLTIGDPMTFSTYIYTLRALKEVMPEAVIRTFPGVTSYSALASALQWPLGESKERVLILPCPDSMEELEKEIQDHDVVVLMKIGKRMDGVLTLLQRMGIAAECVYGKRVGMPEEYLCSHLDSIKRDESLGYLGTLLIRKKIKSC